MKYSIPGLFILIFISCISPKYVVAPSFDINNEILDTLVVSASPIDKNIQFNPGNYKATNKRNIDLLHTKLTLSFDREERKVIGKAELSCKPYFYSIEKVELDAVNFDFARVALKKVETLTDLKYDYNGRKITLYLDKTYHKGEVLNLQIEYEASPEKEAVKQGYAIGSDQGLFFIDPDENIEGKPTQIWTQGETKYNSRWFPTVDSPNERCTQEIIVRVEDRFVSLSNGLLISSQNNEDGTRTDHWKMDLPHAPYLFSLVIGEYAVVKELWNNKEIGYYVYPEYEKSASQIFNNTPEMLSFFSEITGVEYPWPKYSQVIVSDFVSGAMENTSAVTFAGSFQKAREDLVDYPNDMIVAHEMSHQWFGNYVTCESWANTALNEGFANYSEYLWTEHKKGETEAEFYRMSEMNTYLNTTRSNTHDLIDFEYSNRDGMFDIHSYNKGGLILHMLRKYIGDEAFFAGLNRYLRDNAYSSVEAHDLRLAFEKVCGEDLNWFFNQWFFDKGHPILEINHSYNIENNSLGIEIEQVQDTQHHRQVFIFPMEYQLLFKDGQSKKGVIWVDKRKQTEVLEMEMAPEIVLFNSNKDILCKISQDYTKDQYKRIYNSDAHDLFRYEAIKSLAYDGRNDELFKNALAEKSSKIRRMAIGYFEKNNPENVFPKLREIVLNDPNSINRAKALKSYLKHRTKIKPAFIDNIMQKDSSANVISVCLNYLNKMQSPDALSYAKKWKNSSSRQIEMAVGEVFAKSGAEGYLDFFTSRILNRNIFQAVPLVNSFKQYLSTQDPEIIFENAKWLVEEMKKRELSAYRSRIFEQAIYFQIEDLTKKLEKDEINQREKELLDKLQKLMNN